MGESAHSRRASDVGQTGCQTDFDLQLRSMGEPSDHRAGGALDFAAADRPRGVKVLYRLHERPHRLPRRRQRPRPAARRRPKDFDIGTWAHPYQIKKLFRNCWIIGRRFRLAHVGSGRRRSRSRRSAAGDRRRSWPLPNAAAGSRRHPVAASATRADRLLHRDNTFGTPEEDAFRRDFTINGSSTTSRRSRSSITSAASMTSSAAWSAPSAIRWSGSWRTRSACCARSPWPRDWAFESTRRSTRPSPSTAATSPRSAPARLLEEFYKMLRRAAPSSAFRMMAERRLLEPIAPELQAPAGTRCGDRWPRLDAYRRSFEACPETLTNAVLLGSLLQPLGTRSQPSCRHRCTDAIAARSRVCRSACCRWRGATSSACVRSSALQRRLMDMNLRRARKRALIHRGRSGTR